MTSNSERAAQRRARRFGTLKQQEDYFRAMIRKYKVGDRVVDAQDDADLRGLVEHLAPTGLPSPAEVDFFHVALSQYKKPYFKAKAINGGSFDVSYSRNALNRAISDSRVNEAFRMLAKNDHKAFAQELARQSAPLICAHCFKLLKLSEVEIDHHPITFFELISQFLATKGIDRSSLTIRDDGGGSVGLEDVEVGREWRAYHASHAKYVPSCTGCNRRKARL